MAVRRRFDLVRLVRMETVLARFTGRFWFLRGAACVAAAVVMCFDVAWTGSVAAQTAPAVAATSGSGPGYRTDQILVKPKAGVSERTLRDFHARRGAEVLWTFRGMGGIQVLRLPKGETVEHFIAAYQQSGLVEYAEPDYEAHTFGTTPNDPRYLDGTLWALNNYGQNGGTPHADIDAPDGWAVLNSASNIVVAVLDTGVRSTHEDLASNMWVNPYDGSHGTNAIAGNTDSNDEGGGHGTMVAGILGAVGNNGKGVVGVAWRVQIMACTCFSPTGMGNMSAILACMEYAQNNGARIINASWGAPSSLSLSNAIVSAGGAGIIFVAACGNNATNIDVNPVYPASWHLDNIVSVAYTTRNDTLAALSNYGPTNVALAAPGDDIYSTFAATDSYYYTNSGTSMAVPYVVGTFALMLVKYPTETYQQIIARVLNGTDPLPSLAGKCVTGGRLNLRKALSPPMVLTAIAGAGGGPFALSVSAGANRTCVIQVSRDLGAWSPIYTNTTSAGGTFEFTDSGSTNSDSRFYRAVSTP
jgi:subtilisin family serine protease